MPSSADYENTMLDHSQTVGGPMTFAVQNKSVVELVDTMNGSYSAGQINYNLTQLATNKGFIDWNAAHIVLPATLTVKASGPHFTPEDWNVFSVSLKNCVYQLIHSLQLTCNGQALVSSQQWTGIIQTYLLLSSWSQDDQTLLGPEYLFAKDSSDSIEYNTVLGETNNRIVAGLQTNVRNPGGVCPANEGRLKRVKFSAVGLTDDIMLKFATAAHIQNSRRNSCTTTDATTITYELQYVIPLKGLHDVFEKIPLCRGSVWGLTINTHLPCESTVVVSAASVVSAPTSVQIQNGIMPFQLTTPVVGAASCGLNLAAATTIGVRCTIGNTRMTNSVIRIPLYELSPQAETAYLEKPVRTIRYLDFLSSQLKTAPNATLNSQLICPGRARIRRMVLFPTIDSGDVEIAYNGSGKCSAPASLFSSSPATAAPFVSVTNLNVQLSGRAIYPEPKQYSYQSWLDEVKGSASINGLFTHGLTSGLVNRHDYETCYGVVDIDLSRHLASEDEVAHQVSINMNVQSAANLVWYIYLFYEQSVDLDCDSGQIVSA